MKAQDDKQDYFKISEVAKLLNLSTKTIYRHVLSGDLEAIRMGGVYLIPRSALNKRTVGSQIAANSEGAPRTQATITCGSCYQIITGDNQIGAVCQFEGCEQVICTQCLQKHITYCLNHRPTSAQAWQAAEQKLRQGEINMLVKSSNARQREIIFLNRIDARLSNIKTLLHPASGELWNILSWEQIRENTDDQAQLLKFLRKLFLDSATLARYPLNAALSYYLQPGKGQKGEPLEIAIQVLSRMDRMVQQQYDSEPLGAEMVTTRLNNYIEGLDRAGVFRIVLLASLTGWDEAARHVIEGTRPGTAFFHRRALVYLYDLEKGELVFNSKDEHARGYANLFAPSLPEEELEDVIAAIENEMITYDSLALVDALTILPYRPSLVEAAFKKMAGTSHFKTIDIPQVGTALVRQRG